MGLGPRATQSQRAGGLLIERKLGRAPGRLERRQKRRQLTVGEWPLLRIRRQDRVTLAIAPDRHLIGLEGDIGREVREAVVGAPAIPLTDVMEAPRRVPER